MNRTHVLLAIAMTTLLGCKKQEEAAPAPAPAPKPAATVPPAVVPSAPPPRAANADCGELKLALSKDKVTYAREVSGAVANLGTGIDRDGLIAALAKLAATCIGPVSVAVTDDFTYQDVVTVMDLAQLNGFHEIGIDLGDDPAPSTPAAAPAIPPDPKTMPVVMVSTTEVTIGATTIPLAATDLERKVQTALDAMKTAGAPAGTVILQADVMSKGKTLNAIVLGARRAGFDNVLFAVKNL